MQITDVSPHARARMQQRAVTPALLDLLDAYGATTYDHEGGHRDSLAEGPLAGAMTECPMQTTDR